MGGEPPWFHVIIIASFCSWILGAIEVFPCWEEEEVMSFVLVMKETLSLYCDYSVIIRSLLLFHILLSREEL